MTIETVKNIRIGLDEKIRLMTIYLEERVYRQQFTLLIVLQLTMARMWMGKLLGEMGTDNPYPNSTNPENNIVDAATDKSAPGVQSVPLWTIEEVKRHRKDLEEMIVQWTAFFKEEYFVPETTPLKFLCVEKVLGYLMEAKMLLGMELEELGKEQKRDEMQAANGEQ